MSSSTVPYPRGLYFKPPAWVIQTQCTLQKSSFQRKRSLNLHKRRKQLIYWRGSLCLIYLLGWISDWDLPFGPSAISWKLFFYFFFFFLLFFFCFFLALHLNFKHDSRFGTRLRVSVTFAWKIFAIAFNMAKCSYHVWKKTVVYFLSKSCPKWRMKR